MSYYGYSYAELSSWQHVLYCNWAAGAILFFDHLITLGDEIEYIWRRKFTAATFLFMINRYATICKTAIGFMLIWADTEVKCLRGEALYKVFDIIALFVFAAFSSFRVWAIWGRDIRPFFVILPFALATPALNIYRVSVTNTYYQAPPPPPWGGCYSEYTIPMSLVIMLNDLVRSISIATDALVLIMTWIKTYGIYKASRRARIGAGLSELLLRDGTSFFGFLLLFNVLDLVLNQVSPSFNPVNYFSDVVNCLLISRFMLNLRSISLNPWEHAAGASTVSQGQLEFIHTNVLGDFGGPVVFSTTESDSDSELLSPDDDATRMFKDENGPLALEMYTRQSISERSALDEWGTGQIPTPKPPNSATLLLQPCTDQEAGSVQGSDRSASRMSSDYPRGSFEPTDI